MPTEHISPRYADLDSWPSTEMVEAMYEGQPPRRPLTLLFEETRSLRYALRAPVETTEMIICDLFTSPGEEYE